MTAPIVDDEICDGVCMGCGGAVLNSGEHVDPERHAPVWVDGQLWEREAVRDVQAHGEPVKAGRDDYKRWQGNGPRRRTTQWAQYRAYIAENIERRRPAMRAVRTQPPTEGESA